MFNFARNLALGVFAAVTVGVGSASAVTTYVEAFRGGPSGVEWNQNLGDPDFGSIPLGDDLLLIGAYWKNGVDAVAFTMATPFKVSLDQISAFGDDVYNAPTIEILDPTTVLASESGIAAGANIALFDQVFAAGDYAIRIAGSLPGGGDDTVATYDLRVQAVPGPAAALGLITAFGLAGGVRRLSRRG